MKTFVRKLGCLNHKASDFTQVSDLVMPKLREVGRVDFCVPPYLHGLRPNDIVEIWRIRRGGFAEYARAIITYSNGKDLYMSWKLLGRIKTKLYKGEELKKQLRLMDKIN